MVRQGARKREREGRGRARDDGHLRVAMSCRLPPSLLFSLCSTGGATFSASYISNVMINDIEICGPNLGYATAFNAQGHSNYLIYN